MGEKTFSERSAPSGIQNRGDHGVKAGQNTNGVSAFVLKRITRSAAETTHNNVNE